MNEIVLYSELIKPSFAPPGWVFGPVWAVLYFFIAVSFFTVFYKVYQKQLPSKLALPFVLNIIFNVSFTPIQFGLQNNFLALIDVILVLFTLVWALISIWKHVRWVALVNIPYLLWCCFAVVLQCTITIMNWK